MKRVLFLTMLLTIADSLSHVASSLKLTQVDPLQKILLEDDYFAEYDETPEVARGETANYQLAFKSAMALSDLRVSVSPFRDEKGTVLPCTVSKGFESYVYVGQLSNEPADDQIHSPSHLYPDPILGDHMASLAANRNQPVWLSVDIDRKATAGTYHATVTITALNGTQKVTVSSPIAVKVYPVTMEGPSLWMDNWFSLSPARLRYFNGGKDVAFDSPFYWNYTRQLATQLRRVYNNVSLLNPWEHIRPGIEGDHYTFDYTRFDRIVDSLRAYGVMKMLEISTIGSRAGGWNSSLVVNLPILKGDTIVFDRRPFSDPDVKRFLRQYLLATAAHMKERRPGLPYAQKLFDEPDNTQRKEYIEVARYVKGIVPDVPILEAVMTTKLDNMVDIWVQELGRMDTTYNELRERQREGSQVWLYTCWGPRGNYANRFVELPVIKTRLLHWINYRYGLTGYLHWGFNCWFGKDPLHEQYVEGQPWPGGDAWIVYPSQGHIYGSLRLEEMRRGVQDYTLLSQLAKKDKALADKLCASIVHGWDSYDTSSASLNRVRHEMLEALK